MRGPKQKGKRAPAGKRGTPPPKQYLQSPFRVQWPSATVAGSTRLADVMHSALSALSKEEIHRWFCLGVNHVTRSVEKDPQGVVVIGIERRTRPANLLQHLPVMAELNEIPMCGFRDAQGRMQKLMALKKLSCFALKRGHPFPEVEEVMVSLATPPAMNCLRLLRSSTRAMERAMAVAQGEGQDAVPVAVVETGGVATAGGAQVLSPHLHPAQVVRVAANPNRVSGVRRSGKTHPKGRASKKKGQSRSSQGPTQ